MTLDVDTMTTLLALRAAAIQHLNDLAHALLHRPLEELTEVAGFAATRAEWRMAERQARILELLAIRLVPIWALPAWVQSTVPRPPMLFVRGAVEALGRPAVGIVGARNARRDAAAWAFDRAIEAATTGHVVVSGGARGADAAAHRGALRGRGPTVAYLGVPADRIYPSDNKRLFRAILDGAGAVASEHPPGVSTPAFEHSRRNRFIAAHANRLLIAEARASSGTLVTAQYARRYGVPVFVSPPGVGAQRDGINRLLEAGHARPYEAPPSVGLRTALRRGKCSGIGGG